MKKLNKGKLRLEQTTMGAPSVGAGGHIDLALGQFDRPGPDPKKDFEKAIVPTEMVATQLATERPPVEDEDYVPSSIAELSKAASEIAKLIPPEQVKKFYLKMKELADESVERQEITTIGEKEMQEARKFELIKMINEQLDELMPPRKMPELGEEEMSYEDIVAAIPEEFQDVEPDRLYYAARKADIQGRDQLQVLLDNVPETELDKIMKVAKDEYIDLFEDVVGEDADPEDIDYLKKLSPLNLYETSDTFNFFYKAAFVIPAAKKFKKTLSKINREASVDLARQLKSLKVPSSAISTAINQIMGVVERKPAALKQKFIDAGNSGELRPIEVDMAFKNFMMKFGELERKVSQDTNAKRAEAAKTFTKDSLDNYSKTSLEKRKDLIQQAFATMSE